MQSIEDLIPKLSTRTEEGLVSWSEGKGPNTFTLKIGEYFISIWKWEDEDEETGLSIGLRLDEKKTDYLDIVALDKYSAKFPEMSNLYTLARRSSKKVDKIITELDRELDGLI